MGDQEPGLNRAVMKEVVGFWEQCAGFLWTEQRLKQGPSYTKFWKSDGIVLTGDTSSSMAKRKECNFEQRRAFSVPQITLSY